MTSTDRHPQIELRGVRVHNLQNVDLDLPLGQLIVVTGVSGAGKSSLAFDTLYAEGQRRYVESFSTYARRFLERFEKPDADRIAPIPPAVAVRQKSGGRSRRATVGTVTEIYDFLRLLFAAVGIIECPRCRRRVERQTPATAQAVLVRLAPGTRFMIGFPIAGDSTTSLSELSKAGFTRLIIQGKTVPLAEAARLLTADAESLVVVDRLTAGPARGERIGDSLELAFRHGDGACRVLVQRNRTPSARGTSAERTDSSATAALRVVDDQEYESLSFHTRLVCPGCGTSFAKPEPALFNFNSPLGACPTCHGIGTVSSDSDAARTLRECPDCHGARLRSRALAVRVAGRSIIELTRLTAAELLDLLKSATNNEPVAYLDGTLEKPSKLPGQILAQAVGRLEFLIETGLPYLTLDRPARTLSGGEAQRVRLTAAFGSKFVNMLYVLDEPTTGLHARDTERLLAAIRRLRDAGNTVVVVEHDGLVIRRADQVIDIGPGAGREGGRVVFQGTPDLLAANRESATADFLSGRRLVAAPGSARRAPTGWLRLSGVEHHNLHDVAVDFPLGLLCVVSGVSGSGKSSLVEETLYPAVSAGLARRTPGAAPPPPLLTRRGAGPEAVAPDPDRRLSVDSTGRFASLTGLEQIDDVVLIDQSPIGRSARANPASFLNLFGEIRTLFAGTAEAMVKNFSARHFSFNSAGGGRCETCRGAGSIAVDMQFLPDVTATCPDCHGTRYRREILEARYRGLSIAEVLALDGPRGLHFLPRQDAAAAAAQSPQGRGARLPDSGAARRHALQRRIATLETGRVSLAPAGRGRCSSWTNRRSGCTRPTSRG